MSVAPLNDKLRTRFEIDKGAKGIVVTAVTEDGLAAEVGIEFLADQWRAFAARRIGPMALGARRLERVIAARRLEEVSIGDYVLNGGEVAAMVVVDAVMRLIPGVLGDEESSRCDSFSDEEGWLEGAQYTRPRSFRGWEVPEVLRSGDHARIERFRLAQALHRTIARRPDLIEARGGLSEEDKALLEEFPPLPYPSTFTI